MKEIPAIECEKLVLSMELLGRRISITAKEIDLESAKRVITDILKANNIFLMGAGRSGLVAKAFAMRLMQLGFSVFVVGESTTPAVQEDDVVIAISGSGETRSIADLGRIAKEIGSCLVTITSNSNSTLGRLSDTVMIIPGRTKNDVGGYLERHMRGEYTQLSPLGTSFEVASLVFLDAMIAEMISITGASEADLKSRHTILE
ncbi:MAG: 6-phospho-3-hexuloisomerase [Methanosarcinaceae archaeon]|nr:6-phospho-3-hexuloisomerase [Methanosarcinaceae archaeon]